MKTMKFSSAFGIVALCVAAFSSQSQAFSVGQNSMWLALQENRATALDVINWKVGDSMTYDLELGFFGKLGSMTKSVAKDEGETLWVKNDGDLMGQKDLTEIQIRKLDGKILKLIHNGQEQQIPDEQVEIISQEYTEITVPAGKFKVLHISAKSTSSSKIEIWANPQATALEGAVQQIVATQFGDMTMKLTAFKKN